ncbi:hypothetical protein JOC76_002513 [Neobacillus cucumis]|nr:hypothetical protein [Neobacillus cucumis]
MRIGLFFRGADSLSRCGLAHFYGDWPIFGVNWLILPGFWLIFDDDWLIFQHNWPFYQKLG